VAAAMDRGGCGEEGRRWWRGVAVAEREERRWLAQGEDLGFSNLRWVAEYLVWEREGG
jgi:hypothetical protein